jgi:hypothetical protein
VLQLLYANEPDAERAYYETYGSIKQNKKSEEEIIDCRKTGGDAVKSFYVEIGNKKTGEIKYYAGAFGSSNSVTLSASYVPGYPNPFVTDIGMVEKIAINALNIANN